MLKATNITKRIKGNVVLDNVSFCVGDSDIHGLIGAKGSGRTTILQILSGILKSDSGTTTLNGVRVYDNTKVKERIFYVPNQPIFVTGKKINELMSFYDALYKNFNKESFKQIVGALQLHSSNFDTNKMPPSERRLLAFEIALACKPEYLLLDDFFDALSPQRKSVLLKLIQTESEQRGMSTLISSGDINSLSDMCNSISLINNGQIQLHNNSASRKDD